MTSAESAIHFGVNLCGIDQTGALNRAFSAEGVAVREFLGRCPRLPMNTAPLALNMQRAVPTTEVRFALVLYVRFSRGSVIEPHF